MRWDVAPDFATLYPGYACLPAEVPLRLRLTIVALRLYLMVFSALSGLLPLDLIVASGGVTMSQKYSDPQAVSAVSQLLMPDTLLELCRDINGGGRSPIRPCLHRQIPC